MGGRRQQRGAEPDRALARAVRRRREGDRRVPRRADGALQLVEAQPVLPAGAGDGDPFVHLHAGALPQAVPREVRRSGRAQGAGAADPGARLGAAARPQRRHVQVRGAGAADAAALARHHAAAGRALRVRAQPPLPPRRPRGDAAALHRPRRAGRGRQQARADQDRRRRDRPAGARPVLQALHLPQGERAAQRPQHLPVADRARRAPRALPEPQRAGQGVARAVPRRPLPPRAVARGRPRRDQPDPLLRPRHRRRQHGAAAEPALQARVSRRVGDASISPRPTPCSTRSGSTSARTTGCGCCRTAGRSS